MSESEQAVRRRASAGDDPPSQVCRQLLLDPARYALWRVRHDGHMTVVASARLRVPQILSLRALSVEQIHWAALMSYLRKRRVEGAAREQTLREFHGVMDSREAALVEHRVYLLAASTQFCSADILERIGDREGLGLLHDYELTYAQYFAMFCERARARRAGASYLLAALMPEVHDNAERIRGRLSDDRCFRMPRRVARAAQIASGGRRSAHRVRRSNA
jgi:hypothetical protein